MSSSTSTSTSDANEESKETVPVPFQVQKRDILFSNSTRYLVLDFNGEGCFGKVAKCVNLTTAKMVAVKIHKKSEDHVIQREVEMLEAVRALDPEKKNIVRFMDNFRFHNLSCLAFEMLDRSLWDLIKERMWTPLSLNEIRPVTHQLLIAFEALKGIGILHTDLKPDNIMLVNHKHQPFKVKLIDFGLALPVSKMQVGMTIQANAYRAPEVTLGLPLSEAVDMWGVGCVMAFLYFGTNLFPGNCAYHTMKAMLHLLGQPEDHLLSAGINTWQYFSREEGSSSPGWRLKSPEEYKEATDVTPQVSRRFFDLARNLEDAVQRYPAKRDALEYEDRMAFLSLLKWCLHLDAGRRIKPKEALKHSFVTMVHLVDEMDTSPYADDALQFMTVSPLDNLDESDDSLTNSDNDMELRDDQASDSADLGRSSYEESDPIEYYFDFSNRAVKTDLKRVPSTASFYEKDSITESSRDSDTESSSGNDADIDTSSDEDDIDPATSDSYGGSSSDDTEPAISDSCDGGFYMPSFTDKADIEPATSDSYGGSSFILSSSDEDNIEPTTSDSCDGGFYISSFTDEDDIEPATSDSYGGSSFILSSSDEDNIEPSQPCFNFDEISSPTGLQSASSIAGFSEEDSLPESSSDGHSNSEISSHGNLTGPSAATDFQDGVRDTDTLTKVESGPAATSSDDSIDTVCVPIAFNTYDDRALAAAGSTYGAAASISSNDRAPAAIRLVDVDDVKKKKKKNLFQRTCKFFCRVKTRVVSIFKCRKN
ncbi:homeodomain-interacting protein kinase 3-like [Siniperca chuatsi]|uniref:homeodomain-interacting protein kinase 3-like n=1 Tax=Siniperca chuatsi TaxID=119488 RepID=UPI001CE1B83D|nr:homeodomain-interacting protein kinase 3-like [Siniperca chuatsi]